MSTGVPISGRRTDVRVVVAGDPGTGKSSLIAAVASGEFMESVPPVLSPVHYFPDGVWMTIVDTSARSLEDKAMLEEELKRADVVVLTHACDKPETISHLKTFWIPEVRRLKVKVPVICVGCKSDLLDEQNRMSLQEVMKQIMQQCREIESFIECSASQLAHHVHEVFHEAQNAVLHPTAPLFDKISKKLKPRCIKALNTIFFLCDHDRDFALNDHELTEWQVKCFNAPLPPPEIENIKRILAGLVTEGVNKHGLTLKGFVSLHEIFILHGHAERTWTVLRKFGYNDDLELQKDNLPVPLKKAPDQRVELTTDAVDFLKLNFSIIDKGASQDSQDLQLKRFFINAPESPWGEAPYQNSVERNESGDMSQSGFLSQWALMTLLDPAKSLAYLIYSGYSYAKDPATALRVTRKRTLDVKKQHSDRQVFQCFVFGPENAGKSALLSSFVGRSFENSTSNQSYTANVVKVDHLSGTKTLVLREIQEADVKRVLSSKESLAACDVAVFVYDSSDEYSFKRTSELLMDVARLGEDTGYGVPCLLIAAKHDLGSYPEALRDSKAICWEMKIEEPIRISVKGRDMNEIFSRVVNAAEHCLSIPETQYGRKKQYRQLVNRSLMFASVGAAAVVIALSAYLAYASRKSQSGS